MAYQSSQVDVLEGFARLGLDGSQSSSKPPFILAPGVDTAPQRDDWIMDPNQVSVDDEQPLGSGIGSQMTFKGRWNGSVVAVRRLPPETSQQVRTLLSAIRTRT